MQFQDFSPPNVPTLDQQRDALQKGLGRVMQWAANGKLETELLLDACLHDLRYDRQFENNRGEWLWKVMTASGKTQHFREPILDALRTVNEKSNADQLCELALQFALNGDDAFRLQLYDFVGQRQIPGSPEFGEEQLLLLDGENAFLFIAHIRGRNLATNEWEWHDSSIIRLAIDELGEARVLELISESSDPEICRFVSGWRANLKSQIDQDAQQPPPPKTVLTVNEVLVAVHGKEKAYWLMSWGMNASERDLELVLNQIWIEHDPAAIAKLLRIFSNRPMPVFDPRLIELCRHPDDDVQRWALSALQKNSNPLVRAFAFQELKQPTLGRPVVNLLIKNFEKEDEQRLLDHVELSEVLWSRHRMLIDIVHLLEQNEESDCSKLGQIAYFHTPCQECRHHAAQLLFDRNNAPSWLVEECRSDANEDNHTLGEPELDIDDVNSES